MGKNIYRMLAYALIAVGLINWDYQRAKANIVPISAISWLPGIIFLIFTFSKGFENLASKRGFKTLTLTLSVIIFATQIVLR